MTRAKDLEKAISALPGPTVLDLLMRLRALVDAADEVVGNWSEGDLAGAVNQLEAVANDARELLEHRSVTKPVIRRARRTRL